MIIRDRYLEDDSPLGHDSFKVWQPMNVYWVYGVLNSKQRGHSGEVSLYLRLDQFSLRNMDEKNEAATYKPTGYLMLVVFVSTFLKQAKRFD